MKDDYPVLALKEAAPEADYYDAYLGEVIVGQVYYVKNQNYWSCICWLSFNMRATKSSGWKTGCKSKDDAVDSLRLTVWGWLHHAGLNA